MSSTSTSTRRRALLGGALAAALVLAGGIAVWAGPDDTGTTDAAISTSSAGTGTVEAEAPTGTPETTAVADTPTTVAPPATTAPAAKTSPTTSKATTPTTAKAGPPTTTRPAAAPAPAPAPAAPAAKSGQRVNPTPAQVQAAITTLHQRIPLFEPNEAQLRTFAEAACAQFDQGQTHAQVVETVRKAVTYIQGASLSAPDADFAVRTVLQLRCPGYL
ncbi:MAG TPA: hypothetical protein VHF27_03825 [Acidimicrobiales bacterium]|nr:hypothetical protein [Acidimicrobiales bacterium]